MIRVAHFSDIPRILTQVRKFNDTYYDVPLDEDRAEEFITRLVSGDEGVVMISDAGFIAAVPMTDPFRSKRYLVEIGWYAEDNSGLRLLKSLEDYARMRLYDEVRMTTLESNPGVEKLLSRKGYTAIETSHRLKL